MPKYCKFNYNYRNFMSVFMKLSNFFLEIEFPEFEITEITCTCFQEICT